MGKIYQFIDLTALSETDTAESITQLCELALQKKVAAICIAPQFVKQVYTLLAKPPFHIATVANFPHGESSLQNVQKEISEAILNGAEEIDVVFPYKQFLNNNIKDSFAFIESCKKLLPQSALLKVILETGALLHLHLIKSASKLCIDAGADFLKTSTGKIGAGATPEAVEMMLGVIQKNKTVGIKISGGIRAISTIQNYIQVIQTMCGEDWITPRHVRFGMSKLPV